MNGYELLLEHSAAVFPACNMRFKVEPKNGYTESQEYIS